MADEKLLYDGTPAQPTASAVVIQEFKKYKGNGIGRPPSPGHSCIMALEDVAWVSLTNGLWAVIDAADISTISCVTWFAVKSRKTFYARRNMPRIGGKASTASMHRVIVGCDALDFVDHRNCNGLDNRRSEIRVCTQAENARNCNNRINNRSGLKGVSWVKSRGKFVSQIQINGRGKHLGYFDTIEEAHRAYSLAAGALHGEFARLE